MEEDAEKKNIAKLDFNVKSAINSLDKIDKKLKEVSESSEAYAKKIEDNLGKAINSGAVVDSTKVNQSLTKIGNLSKTKADQLSVQLIKIKAKEESDINKIVANAQQKRQTAAYKSALKQEEYNNRVLKSSATLYDKISEYAKTYIIYQGFNELRRGVQETIDEMVDMEYQMVQIERVLNDSSLDIDNYRDKLIQLAYDYGNAFNNVADITLRLAQAGFDADESLALSEKTLLALNTAELDATQATEDMVAVMAQWGLMTGTASEQAETYGNIIDKINKVADNFPTTSEDILEALKKTSSAFNLAGASIDETIATIVAAETASQRGGRVIGTALSNIVQQLKADKKLDLAEQLGLNFFKDANKTEFRPIMEILQEMSERMQSLKDQGKESSTEMQSLLEMFTVFRRNIGASLLGEMAGEDSTYAQVLETSLNSVGYSLQENEKHMKTAKAAQAQFNAELLKLKTQIWDGGLEDVFRDMLSLGTGLVDGIGKLIDKFGLLPVTIATVTLAFSLLNKNTQASNWVGLKGSIEKVNVELAKTTVSAKSLNKALNGTSASFQGYVKSIDKGKVSMLGYAGYLAKTTAQTILLTAKTIILQTVISGGITLAITAIVATIDNWINAEQKAIEKHTQLMEKSKENAQTINKEKTSIEELRKEYEELAKKDKRTTEDNQRIYEIQENLNQLIKDTGTQVELVTKKVDTQGEKVQVINDKYDEQLSKIRAIEYEKKRQETEELRKTAEEARELLKGVSGNEVEGNLWQKFWDTSDLDKVKNKINEIGLSVTDLNKNLASDKTFFGKPLVHSIEDLGFEEQLKFFRNAKIELTKAEQEGKNVAEELNIVDGILENMERQSNQLTEATNEYVDALSELYDMLGFADTLNLSLQNVADAYNIEGPKKLIEEIQNINTEFSNGKINIEEYFNKIQEKIGQIDLSKEGEELQAYQAIFAETTKSLSEGIESLVSGLESGSISFIDYSQGIKEASENMLQLRIEQGNLEKNGDLWVDKATGQVDVYTNVLQRNIEEMQGMSYLMKTIGDNYDYIAEHANAAGQAMFEQTDIGTKAYRNLANNVATSLQEMKESSSKAYEAIVNDIYKATGKTANEIANADKYITEALNGNAQALNAALNASAAQVANSTNKVTSSMGKVLEELGKAVSNFQYTITATPFINGTMGIRKDENGIPTGISLPSFGFDIAGSGGDSVKGLGTALQTFGADLSEYSTNKFTYTQLKSKQKPYTSSRPIVNDSPSSPKSPPKGSGGSSSSSSRDTSAEDAERAREQAYKDSLDAFEDSIDERERLEQRWVKRQKELGLLSNRDYLFITQQRIERYKKYLQEVKNATWMNEEDKLRLTKEYSEKIEDIEVEYLGFLKDQLEDEIDAIEDANKEKIKLIEDEADAKIEALKKVDSARDRDRELEDYQKERQSILDEIAYWEQRTGREAQESLVDARKRLEELDADWQDTQEDWAIDDQIAKIEEKRDAEIAAIEKAEQEEIKALQAIYDAKVKMYAETGNLIYEESTMQSQRLYESYKKNFIDPLSQEFANLNQKITSNISLAGKTTSSAPQQKQQQQQYETYTIKYGDTLSRIAKNFGTTVDKIMKANPYIKNKNRIYAGKTLQIPKFHEGGIFGGNYEEGLALLKKGEVILKPEWSASLDKMMRYFDNLSSNNQTSITNGPTINVDGDLIKVEANVKNQSDIHKLERSLEKMLKDKFNIKK